MAPFTSTPTQFFISSSLTIQNHLILLFTVIIVTFSDGTTAQNHSSPGPPPYFSTPQFNPTMAIIIVILITAFFFLGFFSIYLRQCGNGPGRSNWGRAVTAARSRRVGSRGLDPELIEKFPTLVYSDVKVHKIGKGALECAVCLSEFEDDQMLRLLPICDHVFHPECIDQWLESHTTCPVCRTNLAVVVDSPDSNVEQERGQRPAEAVVEEGSGGGDSRSPGRRDEVEQVDCTAAPPPVLDLRRGGSLRAAARSILAWGSKSARPAVGAHTGAGQIWSEEERKRFTLRLPDYVRQEVLAGKLSRSVSVTVFPTEESLRRGFRGGGGGMDGEGSSRGGGRSWKVRGGGPARSDRWAFLTSFNWRSVAGGGGDGEGSIQREGSIKREGSTRRAGDGGGLEGSTKGKLFGPLDCLGGGGNSVMRDESMTGKDAGDEESQTFAKM